MKIRSYFAIAFILPIMISCNLDGNHKKDFDLEDLYGSWEWSLYQEESELFYVNTYEFFEDGTFNNKMTARQKNSKLEIGYNTITSGTYTLVENSLSLKENKFLTIPEDGTEWFISIDNLVEQEWNRETEIILSMKKRGSALVMDFGPCPPNASCIGPITFYRIGK